MKENFYIIIIIIENHSPIANDAYEIMLYVIERERESERGNCKVILMWHPKMIRTSTIKVKKSLGKYMCAFLCWLSFFSYYERRSHHKNVVKKDREEIFIMCLHTHTHSSTHWDYDTMRVRVCVRFPIILQTLHLIEHSIEEWRTEVTIIISLSPFLFLSLSPSLSRQWSHYTSRIIEWKMMMIIVRVSPFFKVKGISTHLYIHIRIEMNKNS
jgi:hypothetical protein